MSLYYLRSRLHYSRATGRFTWKPKEEVDGNAADWNRKFAHKQAGHTTPDGYVHISLGRYSYRAARLAWFYATGEWPAETVDHKNRNRSDNSLPNLRLATKTQNLQNKGKYARNASGHKGVYSSSGNRWRASIYHNGRLVHLGIHACKEAASAAYRAAELSLRGEFAEAA